MTNRVKIKITAPATREAMESLVGDIAALKLEEQRLKNEMDAQLQVVRENYEGRLADNNDQLAARMPHALAWAEAHAEEFGGKKSLELLHGVIGWRTNPPSLKPLKGWTWATVLDKIKSLPAMIQYVRTKEEVAKDTILADREVLGDGLRVIGCRVVQEDEFFIEPKLTKTEARVTEAA